MSGAIWYAAASVGAGLFGAFSSKSSAEKANAAQLAWNRYNAQVQYANDITNIQTQSYIDNLNIEAILSSAQIAQTLDTALVEYNKQVVTDTALYNDLLYQADIEAVWKAANLDIELLTQQRARERGTMEATQSSSGTVMGEGSNADAIIDQMTQEALDKFIIKTGADDKVAQITNARAQSLYAAEQQVKQLEFEGMISSLKNSTSTALQAATLQTSSYLKTSADTATANNNLQAGLTGASVTSSTNSISINSNFLSGLFGSVSSGVSTYLMASK